MSKDLEHIYQKVMASRYFHFDDTMLSYYIDKYDDECSGISFNDFNGDEISMSKRQFIECIEFLIFKEFLTIEEISGDEQ